MTNHSPQSVEIGVRHRAWMRHWVLPRLFVGARIPSGEWLGRCLGVDVSTANKHMRRVLLEAGVATEVRQDGCCRRRFVVALPERRAAA